MKKVSKSYKIEFQYGINDVEVPDDYVFPSLEEVESGVSDFLIKELTNDNVSVSNVKVEDIT